MKASAILILLTAVGLSAQQVEPEFRVTEKYYDDALGNRLVIRPDPLTTSSVLDIELRIFDETHFDNEKSQFVQREVATIQGGGLGSPGLIFHLANPQSQEDMIQLLELFIEKSERFRDARNEIKGMEESWMGNPEATLSQSRILGEIQTDFINRPATATLNWNITNNRLWMSFNDFINIDSKTAKPLIALIQNIPVYSKNRREYQKKVTERNRLIDESLNLPSRTPLEAGGQQ